MNHRNNKLAFSFLKKPELKLALEHKGKKKIEDKAK
jgi:hypothetical protein